jgi:hypothetical protein
MSISDTQVYVALVVALILESWLSGWQRNSTSRVPSLKRQRAYRRQARGYRWV